MDNESIKNLAKDGCFDELRAESPEILTKALKWLKKKIKIDKEHPEQEPFSNFVKFFTDSGANIDDESIIESGRKWKLSDARSIGSLSLSQDSLAEGNTGDVSKSMHISNKIDTEDMSGHFPSGGDGENGGFKVPSKKGGFQIPGSVAQVSPISSKRASDSTNSKKKKNNIIKKSHSVQKLIREPKQKKKDPNAPKKPPSAYILFCNEKRETFKKSAPDMKQSDILRELGAMWNAADIETRAPYEEEATTLRDEYIQALAEYRVKNPDSAVFAKASKGWQVGQGDKEKERKNKSKSKSKSKSKKSKADTIAHDEGDAMTSAIECLEEEGRYDESPESMPGPLRAVTSKRMAGAKAQASIQHCVNVESSKHVMATHGYEEDHKESADSEDEAPCKYGKKRRYPPASSPKCLTNSSIALDTARNVALRQKHNAARSFESACAISQMKGVKQGDLSPNDDLLHSKLRLSFRGTFPPDLVPEHDQGVSLVMEPYRDFIRSLTAHSLVEGSRHGDEESLASRLGLASDDLALVEEVTMHDQLSRRNIIHATVKAVRPIYPADNTLMDENVSFLDLFVSALELESCGASLLVDPRKPSPWEHDSGGVTMTILFAPFSSQALTVDQFLLDNQKYCDSEKAPFLKIGAQVRRSFPPPEDGNYGFESASETSQDSSKAKGKPCEWMEGQIYAISKDIHENPYLSVKVVWLSQDMGDPALSWVYAYAQTDNDCSPWDLEPSKFVLEVVPHRWPKALFRPPLRASTIVDYLMSLDCASVFRYDLGKQAASEYSLTVPDPADQVDLLKVNKWLRLGRYEGNVGISTLFRDLERMVQVGLKFNECNKHFLPWRQAEMTKQAIIDLKREIAPGFPHLTCLSDALAGDEELAKEREASASSQVVEL